MGGGAPGRESCRAWVEVVVAQPRDGRGRVRMLTPTRQLHLSEFSSLKNETLLPAQVSAVPGDDTCGLPSGNPRLCPRQPERCAVGGSSRNFQGVGCVPQAGAPLPRGRSCVEQPPSGPLWALPCARGTGTEVTRTRAAPGEGLVLGMSPRRMLRASAVASCGRHTSRPRKDSQGVNARGEGQGVPWRSVMRDSEGCVCQGGPHLLFPFGV